MDQEAGLSWKRVGGSARCGGPHEAKTAISLDLCEEPEPPWVCGPMTAVMSQNGGGSGSSSGVGNTGGLVRRLVPVAAETESNHLREFT